MPTDEDWDTLRRRVYRRDDHTCQRCGAQGGSESDSRVVAHHIVPRSEGGGDEVDNLITLCPRCHARVHPENESLNPASKFNGRETAQTFRDTFEDYDLLLPVHISGNRYAVIEHRTEGHTTVNVWKVGLGGGSCGCPEALEPEEVCVHRAKVFQVHPVTLYERRDWLLHHLIPTRGECWAPVCANDFFEDPSELGPNNRLLEEYLSFFDPEF